MTLGRNWAKFNKFLGNRVAGPLFGRLPGFALVLHRGRKSGREYRNPVKVFRHDGAYVITLPYGPQADWVRNTFAAGGCDLLVHGRRVHVVDPVLLADDGTVKIRRSLRLALSLLRVQQMISLTPVSGAEGEPDRKHGKKGDPAGSRV